MIEKGEDTSRSSEILRREETLKRYRRKRDTFPGILRGFSKGKGREKEKGDPQDSKNPSDRANNAHTFSHSLVGERKTEEEEDLSLDSQLRDCF